MRLERSRERASVCQTARGEPEEYTGERDASWPDLVRAHMAANLAREELPS
jgi:hypothetical protein